MFKIIKQKFKIYFFLVGIFSSLLLFISSSSFIFYFDKSDNDSLYEFNDARIFSIKNDVWVENLISQMSLEEKIGQMVFPAISAKNFNEDDPQWQKIIHYVNDLKVGGFTFHQTEINQFALMTNRLQKISKYPLLIAADFERGLNQRTTNATPFPSNMALGAADDENLVYEMGRIISKEGKAIGVHQNYAPVSDVNQHPFNPIINTRSFSESVEITTKLSNALLKGIQDGKMIATTKHFPGHGNTIIDSHQDLPIIHSSKEDFEKKDLIPFKSNFKNGVMSVMVGHLNIPAYDNDSTLPSTLSKNIINGLLKNDLNFKGLVITDALNMKAVTKNFYPAEAGIKAVLAGNDILLFPGDVDETINGIVNAVRNGIISNERIDSSVRKIIIAKKWLGLNDNRFIDIEKIFDNVALPEHWKVADELAKKSITLVKNDLRILPLSPKIGKKYFHLILVDNKKTDITENFNQLISEKADEIESFIVKPKDSKYYYKEALRQSGKSDFIIISIYQRVRSFQGHITLFEKQEKLIQSILKLKKPIVLLSHGNPYILINFPKVKTYLCNYGESEVSETALAQALFGEIKIQGKMPFSIAETNFTLGKQNVLEKSALLFPVYYQVKINENKFSPVEKMMEQAVKDSVFPGAVLLIAKNGEIIFEKPFGKFSYDLTSNSVSKNTIYDLASVSKVIATTTATMICIDKKLFKLDDRVSKYLPQFAKKNKKDITLKNLLLHNSGLPAFKKFYEKYKTAKELLEDIYNTELIYNTGTKTTYSDLGMIILGKVIEKVSKKTLDKFCYDEIFKPLGLKNTFYNPSKNIIENIAPTEVDNYWRKRLLIGEVHDEASSLLNGVAGHAGLFSTVEDLAVVLQMLLQKGFYQGKQIIKKETVELFVKKQSTQSSRGLGWDTKDGEGFSCGNLFSNFSYGHTGYTGTSVWTDPQKKLFVVLLSNRVHPTRNNTKIIKFRPKLHDEIVKSLK